jgi:hypothetical protein
VTIGDRDKVFADLGNSRPRPNPDEKGDAGEAKLGIVVREAPQPPPPSFTCRAWSSSRSAPARLRPAGT